MNEIAARFISGIAICSSACLPGCTNEFLASYQGERFAPTDAPLVCSSKPEGTGLIGTSSFVTAGSFGQPEALEAAGAVGADFVQWSRGLDNADGPAGAGVVRASLSPTGPVSSWAPVQPGQFLYRYNANFFRKGAKDFAVPTATPATTDSQQIIDDQQAATQAVSEESPAPRR